MFNSSAQLGNQRYRGLIVSIAIFLALIGALLAFTFFTSSLLERNTALINTSNQVANDAQAVIKDIFDLQNSYGEDVNSPHIQTVLQRLRENTQSITQALNVMQTGGEIVDAGGHTYTTPPVTNPESLANIEQTRAEWEQLRPKIEDYLEVAGDIRKDSSTQLAIIGEQAKTSSLAMNDSLRLLTEDIFEDAERQANTIRIIQLLGVVAIFAYFAIFVFFFVRRLRESDAEALEARRETEEIMETVNTGLFLLDKNLNIGRQHSQALAGIIGTERIAGENFANVLRGRISDKDLETTRQFIGQLYNPRVKEKLVDDLNPLHKVLLHNPSGEQTDSRYLDFKFSRVYEDKDIARILVNVSDVSEAVYLEQRLEQERAQNDMQIEMLTTILNVDPNIINQFIVNTKQHIEKMNNILKNPGSAQSELESKLQSIYREMHSLKGEASSLQLHSFTKIASEAEDKLHAMQSQGKLSGNDFLPLAVHLDDLLNLSNTIETLGERINQASPVAIPRTGSSTARTPLGKPRIQPVTASAASAVSEEVAAPSTASDKANNARPAAVSSTEHIAPKVAVMDNDGQGMDIDLNDDEVLNLDGYYQDFAQQIAHRQHKQVRLETTGFNNQSVPYQFASVIKEISIQLLRNSIVHGIETPKVRESHGKPAIGVINLDLEKTDHQLVISIRDDGQGIDYDKIRQRLVAMGRYQNAEVAALTQNQLLAALFTSGFTTREAADEDGGRGVGLDIIKERVKEFNGKLNVNSEKGKMTRFIISLPMA